MIDPFKTTTLISLPVISPASAAGDLKPLFSTYPPIQTGIARLESPASRTY